MADRNIVSIDWDPRELRVVHAKVRKGKVRIQDVFAASIPSDVDMTDADQVGQLLHDAFKQERINCRKVIVDIPRDQAVLNTLRLPPVSVSDMAGMVELQAGKDLPFPASEAVIDFAVPPDVEGMTECDVSVGAVRIEVLDFYRKACEVAGLKLERVGLRPFANKVAVTHFLSEPLPERVLMIDIGPSVTEINVLRNGQLVFSRAASVYVPAGGPMTASTVFRLKELEPESHGATAEAELVPFNHDVDSGPRESAAIVADMMVEVTRSLEAYRALDPGAEMDVIVVAGGTGMEESLVDAIQRRFGVEAELYNPASCLDGDGQRAEAACGFSAALGLVLGHAGEGRLHFDFLNAKKQEAPGQAKLKKVPLVAAVVALFVLAVGVFYVKGPAKKFARVRQLQTEIKEAKAIVKDNKKFIAMVDDIGKFERDQLVWVDEFYRVISMLPEAKRVVLNKLDGYQDAGRIDLALRTSKGQEASALIEGIEEFAPEGKIGPYYRASRGASSMGKGKYAHQSTIRIEIVGAKK